MHGTNPLRPPLQHDGAILDVKAIFPTLQAEGPYAGWPAVFVRLGGCNLACDFCDTEFEDFTSTAVGAIISDVEAKSQDKNGARIRNLVVITGGEPLRQQIGPLCGALLDKAYKVQIETNGTLWRELPEGVEIVCSPKNTGQGYAPVRGDLLSRINAFKFLISRHDPAYAAVPEVGQKERGAAVYVQPMDEGDARKNADNLALALQLAQMRGYRLSLQLHKLLGIE